MLQSFGLPRFSFRSLTASAKSFVGRALFMDAKRKFLRAMKWGAIGFAIPIVVLGAIFVNSLIFGELTPTDRENDLANLPVSLLLPAIGCSFVFTLAGYAASAESPRVSPTRSILIITSVVIIALLIVTPNPRYKMLNPHAWLGNSIPVVAGLITCAIIVGINKRVR